MSATEPASIREATEADLPRLLELLHQLSQLGERPDRDQRSVTEAEHAALRGMLSDPRTTCLVIEQSGRVQGTLTFYVLPNLSHGGRPIGIVENVVVDESCRGQGLGQLLMERADVLAETHGCYKLGFTSNQRRADAHRFYERLGYQVTHRGFTRYLISPM